MRLTSALRTSAIALAVLTAATVSASADSGNVSLRVVKAGFLVGGAGGDGTLTFHGKSYPLEVGGLSAGLVIGASKTWFNGTVSHVRKASDVAGVYGGAGGGAVAGKDGSGFITLTNDKGAVLKLSGTQKGLMANADLSGLVITIK